MFPPQILTSNGYPRGEATRKLIVYAKKDLRSLLRNIISTLCISVQASEELTKKYA
jgi:hypothetical protein